MRMVDKEGEPMRRRGEIIQSGGYVFLDLEKQLFRRLEQIATRIGKRPEDVGLVRLSLLEAPPQTHFDFGVNVASLAKAVGVDPLDFCLVSEKKFEADPSIGEIKAMGPFLNLKLEFGRFGYSVVSQILEMGPDYGRENLGGGQRVVIDMSSPNIAKRMSYGHLRSTIIGDALANIYRTRGYEVIKDNHIGDWGTQFGKLITAIKLWGDEKEIFASEDPIELLQDLYVRFEREAKAEAETIMQDLKEKIRRDGLGSLPEVRNAFEGVAEEVIRRKKIRRDQLDNNLVLEAALARVIDTDLEKQGRAWFLKLEQGDKKARRLWKLCVDVSLKEFNQIYELLDVGFELTLSESFYEPFLARTIAEVKKSRASSVSDGALVVDMSDVGLGVTIVQKSDGASLYITRDIACAIYRQKKLRADKAIYVVGEDQKQYFQQLFEILRRLGYKIGQNCEHVYFGMVRLPEGKMSTREGRVVLLKDVISEGFIRAEKLLSDLEKRSPRKWRSVHERDQVIRQIVVGAIKWNDLSQDRKTPIVFDWDKALNMEGNSAPYVQYASVRAKSILEAGGVKFNPRDLLATDLWTSEHIFKTEYEKKLLKILAQYPKVPSSALLGNNPAVLASYVLNLAQEFNSFYASLPVLKAEQNIKVSRLALVAATAQVIANVLGILGIEVPDKM